MPATRAINPSVAARLYAGAVEATPMTTVEISPSAPDLSPLSTTTSAGSIASLTVAIYLTPPDDDRWRRRLKRPDRVPYLRRGSGVPAPPNTACIVPLGNGFSSKIQETLLVSSVGARLGLGSPVCE